MSKQALREALTAGRVARSEVARERDRRLISQAVLDHCGELVLPPETTVAAYEPLATEPGSIELLAGLHRAGYRVIVPRTEPDKDLDWGVWTLTRQAREPLGRDAIGSAAVVLVPALGVDRRGNRLGRGGGSYDRALARVGFGVPVAALLFDGEILDEVPADAWDRPVTAIVTPNGWSDIN